MTKFLCSVFGGVFFSLGCVLIGYMFFDAMTKGGM